MFDFYLFQDKEQKDKWEEGFILTKIKYKKMENDALTNVKLEWVSS
jgi:hypothetical protein